MARKPIFPSGGEGTSRPFTIEWLRPAWRRFAILVAVFAWLVLETLLTGNQLFQLIALAMLGWGAWEFFFSGKYDPARDDEASATGDSPHGDQAQNDDGSRD